MFSPARFLDHVVPLVQPLDGMSLLENLLKVPHALLFKSSVQLLPHPFHGSGTILGRCREAGAEIRV